MPAPNALKPTRLSPALLRLLILLALAIAISSIDRGNLSIAAPLLKDELSISPARLGFLLSAFFWTYACLLPVYGWLVDRVNVYWLLAACFSVWSLATAATGLVHTFAILVLLRFLIGFSEAVIFPANSKIVALNFSEEHRGTANGAVMAGNWLGPALGILLAGNLMARFGWRFFFIALGLISLLWVPAWLISKPSANVISPVDDSGAPTLCEFLSLRAAWGTSLGLWCGNYVNFFLLTWMPYYLVREQNFSMQRMAKIGGAGYLLSASFAVFAGWLSDRWILAGGSPTTVRKATTAGGSFCVAVLLALCANARPPASVYFLLTAMCFFGVTSSNVWAISQRLAGPAAAGRWVGFQNGFGSLSGAVVPVVTGLVIQRTGHFAWAFLIAAAVQLIGSACWAFLLGPVEPVTWHRRPKHLSLAKPLPAADTGTGN